MENSIHPESSTDRKIFLNIKKEFREIKDNLTDSNIQLVGVEEENGGN